MPLTPMMITQFQFVGITGVSMATAAPVVTGQAKLNLTKDCQAPSGVTTTPGQVGGKQKRVIQLDSNGDVPNTYQFWPNSELTPNDSAYILTAEDEMGGHILGPVVLYVGNGPQQSWFGTAFGSYFGS